jgi:release factor glutamine methyltransferase
VPTIHQRVAEGRLRLRAAGLSSAEADISARALAEHLLGWTAERFLVDAVDAEPDDFAPRFDAALARRAAREPLAYIVGSREFWGLALEVTPDVLIPRPETELIVEAALELHPDREARLAVADVGTGSGCVGIAIAIERPAASIVATDISGAAVAVARRNVMRHGLSARIRLASTDLLKGIDGPFDLIVANPPYVRDGDSRGLQPEVRNEPGVALYGGAEGLDAITRLLGEAPSRLKSGGHFVFEFGFGQEIEVERLVDTTPELALVELKRDLQGIARTAVTKRV